MHVRMMPTLLVQMKIAGEFVGFFRALSDSGSEAELVHHNTIAPWYSHSTPAQVSIIGLSEDEISVKRKIEVELSPWYDQSGQTSVKVTLWILPKSNIWAPIYPEQPIPIDAIQKPLHGPLADPLFWNSSKIHLLLGIEVLALLMVNSHSTGVGDRLICQETAMGNMIFGQVGDLARSDSPKLTIKRATHVVNMRELDKNLQKMWHFEDLALCTKKNAENELVEEMFAKTHYRATSGRHVVFIPMNPQVEELGSSRQVAFRRFMMQEKKFDRDPMYKQKYVEFMNEMLALGHMVEAKEQPKPGEMVYYIPHHGIMSSKRFRVVFDASCLTDLGISLNGAQFVGPRLQRDLNEILMRFRRHRIALSADIRKMFRQVRLAPEQWNLQRVFWRDDKTKPLKEYLLVTVIYGLAASPFLAAKSMINGALEYEAEFPNAVHAIQDDFYVDDCVSGADTEKDAIVLGQDIKYVLGKSGFELDKWRSNSRTVLNEFGSEEMSEICFEDLEQTSILGLKWHPSTDQYTFEVNNRPQCDKITKRTILSQISQLFDPNGYVSPAMIVGKILMQEIWAAKIDWDEPVPKPIKERWNKFWSQLSALESIKIPRWVGMGEGVGLQLHGFADSSVQAYGCNIVLRAVYPDGKITCHLLASKSRVAPLKTVTIPRLELAAAELLSQLMSIVRESMELMHIPYFLWTDNTIALHWIAKPIHTLKLYVANRVKKIQELTDTTRWNHIRTHENPADLISRGTSAHDLVKNHLWWHGPEWLRQPEESWPKPIELKNLQQPSEVAMEIKIHVSATSKSELEIFVHNHPKKVRLFDYTKNLGEIKRILTYVNRFVANCRKGYAQKPKTAITSDELRRDVRKYVPFPTKVEESTALKTFIKREQQIAYPTECAHFRKYGNNHPKLFPEKSKLMSLNPFVDNDGLIRVGGRIDKAELPYDTCHPVIVPPYSRLSKALILEAHRKTNHGGTQMMIQYIRANFWISRLRVEIKNATLRCTECTRHRKKPAVQQMGDLPADRLTPYMGFEVAGVDYAGPFLLKETYKRGAPTRKCWIALFVCMCTRAVHLDVVDDLTSAAFISCYERFVTTRGPCTHMYSDNGTSFVGAYKEIKEAFEKFRSPENIECLNRRGTRWTFMSPASPFRGGIYEAVVKSTKHHLTRVIGSHIYTYGDYLTLLKKIEACLNSRPLYAPTDDPMDEPVITPGHLLAGRQLVCPPPINAPHKSNFSVQRIRNEQQKMLDSFWHSWRADFLSSMRMMNRQKWAKVEENVKIGQVAVIVDDNLPPSLWLIGRIVELQTSADGLVRTVVLEVASKKHSGSNYVKKTTKLTRPVQKICILPTEDEFDLSIYQVGSPVVGEPIQVIDSSVQF